MISESSANDTSAFLNAGSFSVDHVFTEMSEISAEGFNLLVKAKRYGKWYVLKSLKPEVRNQLLYKELLKKEFDIAIKLTHPNVVQTIGWEWVPKLGDCIVFEYIEGISLKEYLLSKHPKKEKIRIVKELLSALSYIHGMQVVHRDLKPGNVVITTNGHNAKILDFGLSDTDSYGILKQPAGTEEYMAPEQRCSHVPDCRNDLFSLGKIIQELHIGPGYKYIGWKCVRGYEKRYQNTDEILQDIHFLESLQKGAVWAICIGLIGGSLMWRNNNSVMTVPFQDDSLKWVDSRFVASDDSIMYPSNAYSEHSSKTVLEQSIALGMHAVDSILSPIVMFMDTQTCMTDQERVLLGEMFNTSGIRVQSLVDSLSLKMSLSDKTTLVNALYSYLGNQMGELNKKTDSLIEEKSVLRNE